MKDLKFIFVHGLSGWGSYDRIYKRVPYWGMWGGDLLTFLRTNGFDAYAASVAPAGSAWDRACELYAQLAGKVTDYGVKHSTENRHDRFGRDFSGCPLVPDLSPESHLVLLGHSFGGTTARLFLELMAHGDADEKNSTSPDELSGLFTGGQESCISALVALTSPINGVLGVDFPGYAGSDTESSGAAAGTDVLSGMMSLGSKAKKDGRLDTDYADYDMQIDSALKLNERISTLPSVYYFSVPCSCTVRMDDGTYAPDRSKTDPMFVVRAYQLGRFSGKDWGGFKTDETWRANDGRVNTVTARAPLGEPQKDLDRNDIRPGIWNVFPVYQGDHTSLQGGMMRKNDVRDFYLDLLDIICKAVG